ncbi:hypothetical protein CSC44_6015 [Pseudomonas aeruginosa]|nr:hypothetical protein CSC44_6015 [Pseudomonas aeruginosa]
MFSCSKIEQKQLNTWVSFQSAEQPLLGQFSVSGNIMALSPSRFNHLNHYFRIFGLYSSPAVLQHGRRRQSSYGEEIIKST